MELQEKYDEIYEQGKETFHSTNLELIYSEVYKAIKNYINGKNLCDLGCGDGSFLIRYCTLEEPKEMRGFDFSKKAIEIAQGDALAIERKIYFDFKKLEDIKYELKHDSCLDKNYYDVITSVGVIEHLDDPELLFYVASKLLKPGGMFVVEHPNFLNLRGLIWKTLEIFLDAKMSLTDKHAILPDLVFKYIEKYNFKCDNIRTFHHERGMLSDMITTDYAKRLPLALKDKFSEEVLTSKIKEYFEYLKFILNPKVFPASVANGAEVLYVLIKR